MNDLRTRRIGRTSLTTTELGFGSASLGNLYHEVSDADAADAIGAALTSGINYFDTAPHYGFGLSERRLGDRIRTLDRDKFVVSSKVGRLLKPVPEHSGTKLRLGFASPMPFEPVFDYSYDAIMRSFEDSQQRLGLAQIDILFVHDIGDRTHGQDGAKHLSDLENGGYRALETLRSGGVVKAIGLGVNEWQICESAMDHGDYDCFLLAGRYTLLEQDPIESLFPKCEAAGSTIIIGGAYNSGILATGTQHKDTLYYDYKPAPGKIVRRVKDIEEICNAHGVELAAAALQFPLAHPVVSSVVVGLGSARRIAQTIGLYRKQISDDFWADLRSANLISDNVPTPSHFE